MTTWRHIPEDSIFPAIVVRTLVQVTSATFILNLRVVALYEYVITGMKGTDSCTIYIHIYDLSLCNIMYVYVERFSGCRPQTE
jgi:hypothetical protein